MLHEEIIDKYVRDEMDLKDKEGFERLLEKDLSLQQSVNLTRDISNALMEKDVLRLRDQLDTIHNEVVGVTKTRRLQTSQWMRIASSVVGMAIVASILLLNQSKLDNSEILDRYYNPYESTVRVRSIDSDKNALQQAMTHYDAGNYEEASKMFEQIMAKKQKGMAQYLYAGISFMETNRLDDARQMFDHILDSQNSPYKEQAAWYIGFCHLKAGNNELAYNQFQGIAKSNSHYSKKAKQISRKIRQKR